MTPSEIAGRLMILGSHLEHEGKNREAETCAEAAAWIIFYLDRMNQLPEMQPVTSTPHTTVTPLFNSILKQQ
jgi:hypothetical protein